MFLNNSRGLIIIAAVVALGGLAVAGFMHRGNSSSAAYAPQLLQPSGSAPYNNGQLAYPQPNNLQPGYAQQGNLAYSATASGYAPAGGYVTAPAQAYVTDGYYSSSQRPVYVRQNYVQQPPVVNSYTENREYVERPQYSNGSTRQRTVYRETYHRGRSKAHSVEIVAGTAAVGAVIGGLAGGGKGAAIGAVSGGGAGFAYDRLTHNH